MKSLPSFFLTLFIGLSFASFGQKAKVIAIGTKADWCSICKAYAGRTVEAFTLNNQDHFFQLLVNDITNEESKAKSKPAIVKAGFSKSLENLMAAGVFSFYDAKTKKLLAQVTVANTPEEFAKTLELVRSKVAGQ